MGAFGTVLPVTGLNNGYLGQVSRLGERVITARPVLIFPAVNPTESIKFGDAVTIIPNATSGLGDTYQSISNFIADGGTVNAGNIAKIFAGVANREIKTNVQYTSLFSTSNVTINSYTAGEMAEALERGSVTVLINAGTAPLSQGAVYLRVAANGALPTAVIGGFESSLDTVVAGSNIAIPNVVFRTGLVDVNGVAEITLLNRVAA